MKTEDGQLMAFVAAVRAQGAAWALRDADDNWAVHEDPEDGNEVMPFWADEASARACALGDWAHFRPARVSLDELCDDWLPALDEDAVWVGLGFSADSQGDWADPVELAAQLRA